MARLIVIEGNVKSGKTTIAKELAKQLEKGKYIKIPDVQLFNDWQRNVDNYLDKMIETIDNNIRPALSDGLDVVVDTWTPSFGIAAECGQERYKGSIELCK